MSEQNSNLAMIIPAVIDDAGLSANAFRVLAHIYRRASGKNVAWFGYSDISSRCGIHHRETIRAAILELETRRFIRVTRHPGKRTVYTINPPSEWLLTSSKNELVQKLNRFKKRTAPVQKMNDTRSKNEHKGIPRRDFNKGKGASRSFGVSDTKKEDETEQPNFPACLDTPEFRAKWEEWKKHRAEQRNRLTPSTERKQLARMEAMGLADALASIENSIGQGWTGLFPPPGRNSSGKPKGRRLVNV